MTTPPIALSCGEPAGIGLELAEKAWTVLRDELPFFLIADPDHLPGSVPHHIIQSPAEAARAMAQKCANANAQFDDLSAGAALRALRSRTRSHAPRRQAVVCA